MELVSAALFAVQHMLSLRNAAQGSVVLRCELPYLRADRIIELVSCVIPHL